jgi:TPR repeat protein
MLEWAHRAIAQGDRRGMWAFALCLHNGRDCAKDEVKALELFRRSAELGYCPGHYHYGLYAFGELDWERYLWWGRAGKGYGSYLCTAVVLLLPSFEKGENGRILHIAAPVIAQNLHATDDVVYGSGISSVNAGKLRRMIELHNAMLGRARQAIACWSVIGQRRGVIKDMWVTIAKMAWEETWRWGEKEQAVQATEKVKQG